MRRENSREELSHLGKHGRRKSKLLAVLRPNGVAVLNGDDPLVAAMAAQVKQQRVVRFGSSPRFDYWEDAVSSQWPERLSFQVHAVVESERAQTQLVGTHWKNSVLAAIAAVHAGGLAIGEVIAAIREVNPRWQGCTSRASVRSDRDSG
jgi:UDP-N-acetylmuramoyl-tripeptide--D-alanyl-D-alanine ligase